MKKLALLDLRCKDKNDKMKRWQKLVILGLLLAIFLSAGLLFYRQGRGYYAGDLEAHIKSALSDAPAYSITKPLYKIVYHCFGGVLGVALVVSLFVIGSIWATKRLLDYYFESKNEFKTWLLAIALNFNIAIYIPWITRCFNSGLQEPNEWHNSTYIIMKFFALFAMLLYFKIAKTYLKHIETRQYIIFTILLLLCNLVKPSFIIALAPTMLVFFIIDFIKNIKDKRAIANIVIFGISVLISLVVLVYQSRILYSESSGGGSSIAISFMQALKAYHPYPIISIIQSAAFPLFILCTNIKTVLGDRKYSTAYLMGIISLVIYLLFIETGPRARDGNFDWSYSFALMMMFIAAASIVRALPKRKTDSRYLVACYVLFGLHLISGLIYYCGMLTGMPYN